MLEILAVIKNRLDILKTETPEGEAYPLASYHQEIAMLLEKIGEKP